MSETNHEEMTWRLLNRDGSYNIYKPQARILDWKDLYHSLLRISWPRLMGLIAITYFVANLLFGLAFFFCGPGALEGVPPQSEQSRFMDCFFFSVQTLATIGYGKVAPVGLLANTLVTIEALSGLMGFALITGLIFNRFAKPLARIEFSKLAIITHHDGVPSLVFRIANQRTTQVVEANVDVTLIHDIVTQEGERYRNLDDLKLERDHSPIFSLTWTVVHPITPDSPLYGRDIHSLRHAHAEFLVSLRGTDEAYAQPIHARFSYTANEIVWDRQFEDVISRTDKGQVTVKMEHFHHLKSPV
jgi:inward rectifier potassium channel